MKRRLAAAAAAAGLAVYAWLAVQAYRAGENPERFDSTWILGPPPSALNEAAERRIESAIERLNDASLPPAERVQNYRGDLERAEKLLVRSLRAQPSQAVTLANLAAVRWELSPPLTDEARREQERLIALASAMAPRTPRVQLKLGKLMLAMGEREPGLGYLRRAAELDPLLSAQVVRLLTENLFGLDEMLGALPERPESLVALEQAFRSEHREPEYVEAIEKSLPGAPPALLVAYGNACLRIRQPERLLAALAQLPSETGAVEAERRLQRSRALAAMGSTAAAIEEARRAHELMPLDPRPAEHLGQVAYSAGEAAAAIDAFRDTLQLLAQSSGKPAWRARLYRQIGQAEEALSRPDRAYDAYRKALELDPAERIAERRVLEMERATGAR